MIDFPPNSLFLYLSISLKYRIGQSLKRLVSKTLLKRNWKDQWKDKQNPK